MTLSPTASPTELSAVARSLSPADKKLVDFSPVRLSYVAALRGVKPRVTGTPFAYAQIIGSENAVGLACLAASNPEGCFYGLMADAAEAMKAQNLADARQVNNVTFLADTPSSLLAQPDRNVLPMLDYLGCDAGESPLSAAERDALFALAEKQLRPNGLFAYNYRAYANADDVLRFLVSEFAPEMNAQQAQEFLQEIKALGQLYFKDHPIALASLEDAIAKGEPGAFFAACGVGSKPTSGTFDVLAGLLPHGFTFVGDADYGANYMELASPSSSHDILEKCRDHLLYQPIKDFATQRLERCDIWCRLPVEQTQDAVALFGGFTFGIAAPRERLPVEVRSHNGLIDLGKPPFANLIDLLTILPAGIGDFLHHPNGQGIKPADAVTAMHILVALGVAHPMRAHFHGKKPSVLDEPKLISSFNHYLNETPITTARVMLASTVVGNAVTLSAREALVLQAVNRAGIANATQALLPELLRLTNHPALAAQIMDAADPTADLAQAMITNVFHDSLSRWYAYGLVAA